MTIEMLTPMFDRIAADSWYEVVGSRISLTINDFEGFDEDWCEVEREYEDAEAVREVLTWLVEHAEQVTGDLYRSYWFGDIEVEVGYTSFDI